MPNREMVLQAARHGIDVPTNIDEYNREEFPHFAVYSRIHKSFTTEQVYGITANIIANIPHEHIRQIRYSHFVVLGVPAEKQDVTDAELEDARQDLRVWNIHPNQKNLPKGE